MIEQNKIKLSVVVPFYNEETTLLKCVNRVLAIEDKHLKIEVVLVDDASTDLSYSVACDIEKKKKQVKVYKHSRNQGKGAALRTGFKNATGDFLAVQDADMEYDPEDLKKLIVPLKENKADVVLGSRFLNGGPHRVLYFWHYLGNRFLTFLSNMFTDLNLTDMETCYKVFRKDVIDKLTIEENRFGFEPEIIAKIAHLRLRIFEDGISYYGRTYAEGKKIGIKDGFRALYCIFRYNAHHAPLPIQFFFYLFIGGASAVVNLFIFMLLLKLNVLIFISTVVAFCLAAVFNYFLCVTFLFKHQARWSSSKEVFLFVFVVLMVCAFDLSSTVLLCKLGLVPVLSKLIATAIGLFLNFAGRRFFVFPEPASGPWKK